MKALKTALSVILIAALAVGFVPAAAAADNESVLQSLGHRHTDTVENIGNRRVIELMVPDSYAAETVDLSDGLTITYDTAVYKNVVASTEPAVVNGAAVPLTVTYHHIDDEDDAPKYQTDYSVYITKASRIEPVFSGTITANVTAPGVLVFSNLNLASQYTANDGEPIGAISISGSNPTFGALKFGGVNYEFNTPVSMTSLSQLTFNASKPGVISYDITAYAGADTTTPIGNVVLTIMAFSVPKINSAITDTVSKGTVMTFSDTYFTSHAEMYGMPLVSVDITPTNVEYGTWYLGATAFTTAKLIPYDQLGSLTFAANKAGTATFNWRISNSAGFSAMGTGAITITSTVLTLAPYASSANAMLRGDTWSVSRAHFVCRPETASVTYIKITSIPAAADGYLYLTTALPKDDVNGYPAIAANAALKTGAVIPVSHIGYLRLATKSTSASSQVVFKWTATADVKISTAVWADASTYTVSFTTVDIYKEADMNTPLPLSTSDFNYRFSIMTGMDLSYVIFTIPDKNTGALYSNYDLSTRKGTPISSSAKYYAAKNPNLASLTFVPTTDFTGNASISFKAYAESGQIVSGTLRISVVNSAGGTLNLLTDKNQPLQLDAAAFSSSFKAATGRSLSYVTFTLPSSTYGRLYYDYRPNEQYNPVISGNSVYYVYEAPYLSLVTFVPARDFTGNVSIGFTGYTESGSHYQGKLVVTVADSPGGIVSYSLHQNGSVQLSGNDFSNEFISVTGSVLSYISFTPPPAASGTLYYQYDAEEKTGGKVTAAAKYYDGKTPDISDITFVPAKDYVGQVVVAYTAVTPSGASYSGKLKFDVMESTQTISLMSEAGAPVIMPAASLMNAFSVLSGGKMLSYVMFELPSPSYGKLYYNYASPLSYDSAVAADTKYYLTASPYLSNVYFVPAGSYNGSFSITYTGYTADDEPYTGKIKITVTGSVQGTVSYRTNTVTPVNFRVSDFTAAFTEGTLSHVIFKLPYASFGTLYYGYATQSEYQSLVSSTTRYYVSSWPYLSGVTFVPSAGFTGSLAIEYTAYATSGASAAGTVIITVESSEIETITYNSPAGAPVLFDAEDFNAAFLSKTGSSLNHVRFSLPNVSVGRLYLGYTSPGVYDAAVSSTGKYYRMYSPLLSNVSFVPASGFMGAVTISYTGYTITGIGYSGKVIINVGGDAPFTDIADYPWAADAIAYLFRTGISTGIGNNLYNPSGKMSRGDFVLMITRAFDISGGTDNFPDVPAGSYYYDAISAAKARGIVTGAGGKFSPALAISRQDAMVIIKRTLDAKGIPIASGTTANLAGFGDAADVSDYAVPAVASLVRAGIITGSGGMLHPRDMITRAEMAVILYRVLTM